MNCEYVPINHPGLYELHLKEFTIESVSHAMIGPKTLKRVDKLVIANVKEFEMEQSAPESLESDIVKIVNTTISQQSTKEFNPRWIKEELLLQHSTLPTDFRIHLIDSSPIKQRNHVPSLVIEDCLINGIKMGVNVSNLQMINNRFQILPIKDSLNIHYSKYVWLTGNILKGDTTFPSVNSRQLIGEIKKHEVRLEGNKDSKIFWDAFVFHFRGDPLEVGTTGSQQTNGRIPHNDRTPHNERFTNNEATAATGGKSKNQKRASQSPSSDASICYSRFSANLLAMIIIAVIIQ